MFILLLRYAIFHPLAYLVKLCIEMTMAHLIKTIALGSSRKSYSLSFFLTFRTTTDSHGQAPEEGRLNSERKQRCLPLRGFCFNDYHPYYHRTKITKTQEIVVHSSPQQECEERICREVPDTGHVNYGFGWRERTKSMETTLPSVPEEVEECKRISS